MNKLQAICLFSLALSVGFVLCDSVPAHTQSVPQYLALVTDTKIASEQVQNFMVQSMTAIKKEFPDAAALIDKDMQSLITSQPTLPWQNPADYNTTVFYLGYDAVKMQDNYYKEFIPGKTYDLQSSNFVYVPGAIMCTPVFPSPNVNIASKYLHITLKITKWQAFLSNAVLESLFVNNGPLKSEYDSGFFMQQDQTHIKRYQNMKINNENVDVNIIKSNFITSKKLDLKGIYEYCDDAKPKQSSTSTNQTYSHQINFFLQSLIGLFVLIIF